MKFERILLISTLLLAASAVTRHLVAKPTVGSGVYSTSMRERLSGPVADNEKVDVQVQTSTEGFSTEHFQPSHRRQLIGSTMAEPLMTGVPMYEMPGPMYGQNMYAAYPSAHYGRQLE